MVLDAVSNFVRGSTDAAVGTSDTTVSVVDASIFPDPATDGEFNVVIWDANNFPRPDQDVDVEILRVTARDTTADELTVVRGQETTAAAAHPSGSAVHLSPTAKMFGDIEGTFADFWDSGTQELTADVNNESVSTESVSIKKDHRIYRTWAIDGADADSRLDNAIQKAKDDGFEGDPDGALILLESTTYSDNRSLHGNINYRGILAGSDSTAIEGEWTLNSSSASVDHVRLRDGSTGTGQLTTDALDIRLANINVGSNTKILIEEDSRDVRVNAARGAGEIEITSTFASDPSMIWLNHISPQINITGDGNYQILDSRDNQEAKKLVRQINISDVQSFSETFEIEQSPSGDAYYVIEVTRYTDNEDAVNNSLELTLEQGSAGDYDYRMQDETGTDDVKSNQDQFELIEPTDSSDFSTHWGIWHLSASGSVRGLFGMGSTSARANQGKYLRNSIDMPFFSDGDTVTISASTGVSEGIRNAEITVWRVKNRQDILGFV